MDWTEEERKEKEFWDQMGEVEGYLPALIECGEAIVGVFEQMVEEKQKIIDTLEPYQKRELMHQRKKPRGSIRRNRKE